MITVNPKKRIVRETTAPYQHEKDGEIKTTSIRVLYYSSTTKELKDRFAEAQAKIKTARENKEAVAFWHSDSLVERLQSLPDLVDEETKKPFEITLEFLDALDPKNVKAIAKAIEEDENPKSENSAD